VHAWSRCPERLRWRASIRRPRQRARTRWHSSPSLSKLRDARCSLVATVLHPRGCSRYASHCSAMACVSASMAFGLLGTSVTDLGGKASVVRSPMRRRASSFIPLPTMRVERDKSIVSRARVATLSRSFGVNVP
jgi:hypothetical protein